MSGFEHNYVIQFVNDRGRMVAWLTINHKTIYNVYYHLRYEWFHNTWLCAVDTTLPNTICQWFPAGQRFLSGKSSFLQHWAIYLKYCFTVALSTNVKKTHIPLWVVSFSSCTLLSSILTAFSSSMILSSCVFSVMLDIDLELTDSDVIVNIQNVCTMCVLNILL